MKSIEHDPDTTPPPITIDDSESDEVTQLYDLLRVIVYTLFPLVVMAVTSGLLYTYVDESSQPFLRHEQHAIEVDGSGSTLASTTLWRWINLYSSNSHYGGNTTVTYASIGSLVGESDLFGGISQFGVIDANSDITDARYYLNDDPNPIANLSAFINPQTPHHLGTLMFPLFAGALGVVYNFPHLESKNTAALVFDGRILGDIFCGRISRWNDSAIQLLNPNATLPKKLITVIVLDKVESSSTDIIVEFLATHSAAFNSIVNTKNGTHWPESFVKGHNAFELMYLSSIMPYSIAFIPMEAVKHSQERGETLRIARLINLNGTITDPSMENVISAVSGNIDSSSFSRHNFVSVTDSNSVSAYPLSIMVHALIREHYFYFVDGDSEDCSRIREMVHFLYFAITDHAAITSLTGNQWVPLSANLLEKSVRSLSLVTCNKQNVMQGLQQEFDMIALFSPESYAWDEALTFWNNLVSFSVTKVGYSIYVLFYTLLVLSNAIPFASNMYDYHTSSEAKKSVTENATLNKSKEVKVKWTLQNWLGVVTQCCTCFQILYLCLKRSTVIQESVYIEVISYIGLIFDWFWYYILMNLSVFIWLACMYYTIFLYGFLEAYFPEKLVRLTKFHAFLADFLPNFALIFYNPCVELLAKVFDCRLSIETSKYSNSYGIVCWAGSHWIMVVCSIVLGCGFTNAVVRYCKILKLLRKDFSFKDKDWNIYLESISKTIVIILYFNIANKFFLGCTTILMICMSCCSFFGRPNSVWWYDYIRGSIYAYCAIIYAIILVFELLVRKEAFATRKQLGQVLPLVILVVTAVVCLTAHSYAIAKFKSALTDSDRKKQEEDLKKFFAAFVDELDGGPADEKIGYPHSIREQITSFAASHIAESIHADLLPSTMHRRVSDGELLYQPMPLKEAPFMSSSQNIFSLGHWTKLEELINRAGAVGLISEEEFKAAKMAVTFQDPIIPILFTRCNKNLFTFTELLKVKVWQALADEPVSAKSHRGLPWKDEDSIKGSQFSIAVSVARRDSRRKSGSRRLSNARSLKAASTNDQSSGDISLKVPSGYEHGKGSSGDLTVVHRMGPKSNRPPSLGDGRAGSQDFSVGMPPSVLKQGASSRLSRPRSNYIGSNDNLSPRISTVMVENVGSQRIVFEGKKPDDGHILFSEPKQKLSDSEWMPTFAPPRTPLSRPGTVRLVSLAGDGGKPATPEANTPPSPKMARRTSSKKSSRKTSINHDPVAEAFKAASRRPSSDENMLDVNRGATEESVIATQRPSVVKPKTPEFTIIKEEGIESPGPIVPKIGFEPEGDKITSQKIIVGEFGVDSRAGKRFSTGSRPGSRPTSTIYGDLKEESPQASD
ncbi:hypothetical protein BDR26DRAFT_1005614 [Obelidium mucronatum]|nr:hypothetical protein BDR26DRAFT_1005614 [Obelidium mucronatum]